MKVLFATNNPSKVRFYGSDLKDKGLELLTIRDLDKKVEVDENGKDPLENAIIKAKAYYELTGFWTIAVDDGLYFDNLNASLQPGTHVRRVNGKELNDEEMIEYYTALVDKNGVNGELTGYFLKSVAIIIDGELFTHSYKLNKTFTSRVSDVRNEGYPLDSITFDKEFNKFSSELSEEMRKVRNKSDGIKEFIKEVIDDIL